MAEFQIHFLCHNKMSVEYFYRTYLGHSVHDLGRVHDALRPTKRTCVFLVGDSSLDNKFWVQDIAPALNGYERVLDPPLSKKDVAYWLNKELLDRDTFCLNCAIESSGLWQRANGRLLDQDVFVRDHITDNDVLVVSVGGNDIALRPSTRTILSMLALLYLVPMCWFEECATTKCTLWPPGLSHFVDLFGEQVRAYVQSILAHRKPRKVIVCMIYYPLVSSTEASWADRVLDALNYGKHPEKLQLAIRLVFELATKRIRIPGTEVVAFPLFHVLDGRRPEAYCARVEPSECGGEWIGATLSRLV